jgi:hypothetical protein
MTTLRFPWALAAPASGAVALGPDELPAKRRGRRPAAAPPAEAAATDWLYHELTLIGPAQDLAHFSAAVDTAGGQDFARSLAPALQHDPAALIARLSAAGA